MCIRDSNWLFADTVAGANASANIYSLIETCKANGVDTYRYLVALFNRVIALKCHLFALEAISAQFDMPLKFTTQENRSQSVTYASIL